MKLINKLTLSLLFPLSFFAQKKEIVMTVSGDPVYKDEFEYIFKKNNSDTVISQEDIDEYLQLFEVYKLKVAEAKRLKYDTIPSLVNELNGYKQQLAKPYLSDQEVTRELVVEAFERKQWEIKASHILIKVNEDALPKDTLIAYNKINSIREKAIKGENFSELAKEYSEGPSSVNGGELGYFSSMQMVYPFENAAYQTKVGEVSEIVRTRFGYHIIKVFDKKKASGEITAAHILIRVKESDSIDGNQVAIDQITDIYARLKDGDSFEKLARIYSDDLSTSTNGGRLKSFSYQSIPENLKEFADQSFALENNGDYSEPFKTELGYHIVKRIDFKSYDDFSLVEKEIENKVKRDVLRTSKSKDVFVNRLKQEYALKTYPKNLEAIYSIVSTEVFKGKWNGVEDVSKYTKVILKYGNQKVTQSTFIEYLKSAQSISDSTSMKEYVDNQFENFTNESIFKYEETQLNNKYPEYRFLMKEYNDGVLLFELVQDSVWRKAEEDTNGLRLFFEKNKINYMWPERVSATIYVCSSNEIAEKIKQNINTPQIDSLINQLNQESSINVKIEKGLYSKADKSILERINWQEEKEKIIGLNGAYYFININEVRPSEPKSLEEIKGIVISDYQKEIEDKWIESLRKRHPIKVYYEVLYSVK